MRNEWLERNEGTPDVAYYSRAFVAASRSLVWAALDDSALRMENAPRSMQQVVHEALQMTAEHVRQLGYIPDTHLAAVQIVGALFGLGKMDSVDAFLGARVDDSPEGFAWMCDQFAAKVKALLDSNTNGGFEI
jgi:hypothetical protein